MPPDIGRPRQDAVHLADAPAPAVVLARAEAAELVLSELGGLKRGTLAVAASQTIASYWLARHLVAYRRTYPGVEVKLIIGNTSQVAGFVRDRTSELGFVEGHIEDPSLASETIARDQMMVVVGHEHRWSKRQPVTFDDLHDTDWVLREPGSGTLSEFEEALRAKRSTSPGRRRKLDAAKRSEIAGSVITDHKLSLSET